MRHLLILLASGMALLHGGDAQAGSCLPKLDVPKAWTSCTRDADCVLAGDGCRTCGNFLPVNARHKADAEALDRDARAAAKCAMACEACARSLVLLTCETGTCKAAVKAPPRP